MGSEQTKDFRLYNFPAIEADSLLRKQTHYFLFHIFLDQREDVLLFYFLIFLLCPNFFKERKACIFKFHNSNYKTLFLPICIS